jgi:hypothetical protein
MVLNNYREGSHLHRNGCTSYITQVIWIQSIASSGGCTRLPIISSIISLPAAERAN